MRFVRRFQMRTGGSTAFEKMPPSLQCLIFGISHESDTKEIALHGIASIWQDQCRFLDRASVGNRRMGVAQQLASIPLKMSSHPPSIFQSLSRISNMADRLIIGINNVGSIGTALS